MSQVNQSSSHNSEQASLLLGAGGIIFICWLWFNKVVWVSCTLLYWLWTMVDFQKIHPWVATKINLLAVTGNDAKNIDWHQWLDVMNATSGILLIFLLPIIICCLIGIKNHPSLPFRTKRVVNIHTLPRIMSHFAPTIIPVLAESKSPDLFMNDISPERRWADRPEDFAEQHNLIRAKTLDRDKTREVFLAQLGPELNSPDALSAHEKALFAILGLQVFMDDRKATKGLLDELNRSCLSKGKERSSGKLFWPDFTLAEKHFQKVWASEKMDDLKATHRYVRTALTGLLGRDIRLPPSQYLWLKGIDRTLWYALHGADTASVFIEGAAVIAQTRFEVVVRQQQMELRIDYVETAIDGLQRELEGLGLVHPLKEGKTQSKQKEPDWKPATLSQASFSDNYEDLIEPLQPVATQTDNESSLPQYDGNPDYTDYPGFQDYPDWPEYQAQPAAPFHNSVPEMPPTPTSSPSPRRASAPVSRIDDDDKFSAF